MRWVAFSIIQYICYIPYKNTGVPHRVIISKDKANEVSCNFHTTCIFWLACATSSLEVWRFHNVTATAKCSEKFSDVSAVMWALLPVVMIPISCIAVGTVSLQYEKNLQTTMRSVTTSTRLQGADSFASKSTIEVLKVWLLWTPFQNKQFSLHLLACFF